jgi:hypothetical protein
LVAKSDLQMVEKKGGNLESKRVVLKDCNSAAEKLAD